MTWDIYGNPLSRGHCEVHPHVAEVYPCSQCIAESWHRKVTQDVQNKEWALMDENERLNGELGQLNELTQQLQSRLAEVERERDEALALAAKHRNDLCTIVDYWNRDNNQQAMEDACWAVIEIAENSLDGDVEPEALTTLKRRVGAEAVRAFQEEVMSGLISMQVTDKDFDDFIKRIESGEVEL